MARPKTGGRKAGTPNKRTVARELVEAGAISKIEALLKAAGIKAKVRAGFATSATFTKGSKE